MNSSQSLRMNKYAKIFGFCIVWFAITIQFILMMQNRQADILETTIRFFSFFTILTNILVALYFTASLFKLKRFPFNLLLDKGAITAITAFIIIVGLVYQIVLRGIWAPTGLQYIVDELLHTIIPLFMLGYWFFNAKKEDLILSAVFYWLLYPIIYIALIIVRGYYSGYYPYPFLNIEEIGLETALINIFIIFALSITIITALSIVGKYLSKATMRKLQD